MTEEPKQTDQSPDSSAGEISLENLDEILAEEAPEFAGEMDELKNSGNEFAESDLGSTGIEMDLESGSKSKSRLRSLLGKVQQAKLVVALTLGCDKLKRFFTERLLRLKKLCLKVYDALIATAKLAPGVTFDYLKYQRSNFRRWKASSWAKYSQKTKKEKLLIFGFLVGLIASLTLTYFSIHFNWAGMGSNEIVSSLEQEAETVWSYNQKSETTSFLAAFPQPKHSYLFPKIVVNLKQKQARLGESMGAFQFYVEVDSKDAAVELKSREIQLRDVIQRTTEGFSFESLQTETGKEKLKQQIKTEINAQLAQGWVKSVFIKFMVTKP